MNPVQNPLERLGRYELMIELGRSPTGPLWAAFVHEGENTGRLIALRRIALGDDRKLSEQLLEAADMATRLRDPRVVAMLDAQVVAREVLVASEYVEGETLFGLVRQAVLQKSPIAPAVALAIEVDVLRALRSLGNHWAAGGAAITSVVHGGLGPEQVMVAVFGDAMLIEVGISSAVNRLQRFLNTVGGLPYRAPEQLKKMPHADERTDVFSAGILLWEMLANRPLFGRSDRFLRPSADVLSDAEVRDLTSDVLRAPIVKLDSIAPPGPPLDRALVALVAKALERDPARRFQTTSEMLGAILALNAGSVATGDQVVKVVEQLARPAIAARRAAVDSLGGVRTSSTPPESKRSTGRPPAPSLGTAISIVPPLAKVTFRELEPEWRVEPVAETSVEPQAKHEEESSAGVSASLPVPAILTPSREASRAHLRQVVSIAAATMLIVVGIGVVIWASVGKTGTQAAPATGIGSPSSEALVEKTASPSPPEPASSRGADDREHAEREPAAATSAPTPSSRPKRDERSRVPDRREPERKGAEKPFRPKGI